MTRKKKSTERNVNNPTPPQQQQQQKKTKPKAEKGQQQQQQQQQQKQTTKSKAERGPRQHQQQQKVNQQQQQQPKNKKKKKTQNQQGNNPSTQSSSRGSAENKNSKAPVSSSNKSLKSFCENIGGKKGTFIPNDDNLEKWNQCFEIANCEQSDLTRFRKRLLEVYLTLPHEKRYAPRVLAVLGVTQKVLCNNSNTLQLCVNIFSRRLLGKHVLERNVDKAEVCSALSEIRNKITPLFTSKDHHDYLLQLMQLLSEYENKLEHQKVIYDTNDNDPFLGWVNNPKLGWLMKGEFIQKMELKKEYDSIDEYVETLQRIWTLLTFYWGAAALWSKCKCKQPHSENACGRPLSISTSGSTLCSMKVKGIDGNPKDCENRAKWKCGFRGHDAICQSCLSKQQIEYLKPKGSRFASTDIYDAKVTQTHFQRNSVVIKLSNLESRRPPNVPVQWRTTYRLQPAALVGVVVVPASNLPLQKDMKILWGEVVNSSSAKEKEPEFIYRQRKEMSIRLLSRADFEGLPPHFSVAFPSGSHVAVIDLRVFVPEVLSVLATISHESFREDAANVSFSSHLLGRTSPEGSLVSESSTSDYSEDSIESNVIDQVVWESIENSPMPYVQQLPENDKEYIVDRICRIPQVRSLDETQREAFAQGLQNALHCTQGPPGTGKSYVGVCLILALIVIRDCLKRKYHPDIGPIVTLSYKNHALDEFLMDILKGNPNLRQRNSLIRLGTPENEALDQFKEYHSKIEYDIKKKWENRLLLLKTARSFVHTWSKNADIHTADDSGESVLNCLLLVEYCCQCFDTDDETSEVEEEEEAEPYYAEDAYNNVEKLVHYLNNKDNTCINGSLLPGIVHSANHWHPQPSTKAEELSRSNLLFLKWLKGETPPPRCEYRRNDGAQCLVSACKDITLCKDHVCKVPDCIARRDGKEFCDNHRCFSSLCEDLRYKSRRYCLKHICPTCLEDEKVGPFACASHRCMHGDCSNIQVFPFSFCIDHCCMKCQRMDMVSDQSEVLAGSNLCKAHACSVPSCLQSVGINESSCEEHSCKVCKAVIADGNYCQEHRCQHEEESCQNVRCATKGGVKSKYCSKHTCRYCVSKGVELVQQTYSPNFTCLHHTQCQQLVGDKTCLNLVDDSVNCNYCPFHWEKICDTNSNDERDEEELLECEELPDELRLVDDDAICDVKIGNSNANNHVGAGIRWCEADNCSCHCASLNENRLYCPLHSDEGKWSQAEQALLVEKTQLVSDDEYSIIENGQVSDVDDVSICLDGPPPDLVDRIGANNIIHPDELDIEVDALDLSDEEEDDEDDVNENQQHLHDIIGEEDEDEGIDITNYDHESTNSNARFTRESIENHRNIFKQWSWAMSFQQRQREICDLVSYVSAAVSNLCHEAEEYVDDARTEAAEASASVLKQATVIGGTVVGAANRLSALRASEPFAIIVEEACEVMEPTLVAVLTVPSVQKVQLIGDHRQLPAFVNNCWYDLTTTMPSLKISLFERLVTQSGEYICSVLDVQRRMRPCISDLTKHHYSDVVDIWDHECTSAQRIEDKIPKKEVLKANQKLKQLWACDEEMERGDIPGIPTNIFFWDIPNNEESKNKAGLSACNDMEADAVVKLTEYLLKCGIEGGSISIITPYSGQKRRLVEKLRNKHILDKPAPRKETNGKRNRMHVAKNTVSVSTVDRYQGDENDIVILSLVRVRPGNRFVGLLNRFIVASSRARLGFYIVGSAAAVHGPQHWEQFLEHLRKRNDQSNMVSSCGESFPVCCPQHLCSCTRISFTRNKVPEAFPTDSMTQWKEMCDKPCNCELRCSHHCKKPCHFLQPDDHATCAERLKRKCKIHAETPLLCRSINFTEGDTLETALSKHKCEIEGPYQMPCGHDCKLKCHVFQKIQHGDEAYPLCKEVVGTYHKACGHKIKNPLCHEVAQYSKSPPQCTEIVTLNKESCKHKLEIMCYLVANEKSNPTRCNQMVTAKRPRCMHEMSIECYRFEALLGQWDNCRYTGLDEDDGNEVLVQNARVYGPEETAIISTLPRCTRSIKIRNTCGHIIKETQCHRAFDWIKDNQYPRCKELRMVSCPLCEHNLNIPCHQYSMFQKNQRVFAAEDVVTTMEDNTIMVFENGIKSMQSQDLLDDEFIDVWKKSKCKCKVRVFRDCGDAHNIEMKCSDIVRILNGEKQFSECKEKVQRRLACGHEVTVLCAKRNDQPPPACRQPNVNGEVPLACGHLLKPKTCGDFQKYRKAPPDCEETVSIKLHRCNHNYSIACKFRSKIDSHVSAGGALLQPDQVVEAGRNYCDGISDVECNEIVSFKQKCGHVIENVRCDKAFKFASNYLQPPTCCEKTPLRSPLCQHEILVPCNFMDELRTWRPWLDYPPHEDGKIVAPLLPLFDRIPHFFEQHKDLITCSGKTLVSFQGCGHSQEVYCSELYKLKNDSEFNPVKCSHLRDCHCRNCGKHEQVRCSEYDENVIEETCSERVRTKCVICKVNDTEVRCSDRYAECNRHVECELPCGHRAHWLCGSDEDPREHHTDKGNERCYQCVEQEWELCKRFVPSIEELRKISLDLIKKELNQEEADNSGLKSCVDVILPPGRDSRHVEISIIISRLIKAMKEGPQSDLMFPPDSATTEEFILSLYDLVYLEIPIDKSPNPEAIGRRFGPKPTDFGQGTKVSLFRRELLEKFTSPEGSVKLCVAMAFKTKLLSDVAASAEMVASTKNRSDFLKRGFDCVDVYDREGEYNHERVYWHSLGVIPLSILEIDMKIQCGVCQDFFSLNSKLGAICPEGHFLCYDGCFQNFLNAANQPDAMPNCALKGSLKCTQCEHLYDAFELSTSGCPREVYEDLCALKKKYEISEIANEIRDEETKKREDEIKMLREMDEDKREVRLACEEIREDILTNKCPRCGQAFVDFDGCFALTCSNATCQAGFCAYCFTDCGSDAHEHVRRCNYGAGDYFGSLERLEEVWRRIRKEKIEYLLQRKEPKIRQMVCEQMKAEFDELNVAA